MDSLIKAVELLGEKVFKMEFPCHANYCAVRCTGCLDYPECTELVHKKWDFDVLISKAKG